MLVMPSGYGWTRHVQRLTSDRLRVHSHPAMPAPMPPQTEASAQARARAHVPGKIASRAYRQVIVIQDKLFERIQSDTLTEQALASLARSWCDLEERRRVLTGKPLPGSYRPERKQAKAAAKGFAALRVKPATPQELSAPPVPITEKLV